MPNQQLLYYIEQQLKQKVSKENIENLLLSTGWSKEDINEAFAFIEYQNTTNNINTPIPPNNQYTSYSPQNLSVSQIPAKKPKIILTVIMLIIPLISGLVAWGYFYYFRETPEQIIIKMIDSLSKTQSVEYQGNIQAEAVNTFEQINVPVDTIFSPMRLSNNTTTPTTSSDIQKENKKTNIYLAIDGKYDYSNKDNPVIIINANLEISLSPQNNQNNSLTITTTTVTTLPLNIIILDKNLYIKLNNIDLGKEYANFQNIIANQWIKIDLNNRTPQFLLNVNLNEQQNNQLLKEQLKKLSSQNSIIKITKFSKNKILENTKVYYYQFSLDQELSEQLITNLIQQQNNQSPIPPQTLEILKKNLQAAILSIQSELWIEKKNYLPKRILIKIEPPQNTSLNTLPQNENAKINIDFTFKNYNQPIQISPPQPIKTLEEITYQIFSQMLTNLNTSSTIQNKENQSLVPSNNKSKSKLKK
jgi:hypothetical protein